MHFLLLLSFVSALANGEFPDRIVSDDGRQVQWSAKWPSDVRIEFLGATNLSLRIRCDFTSNPGVKRISNEICFRVNTDECKTLHDAHKSDNLKLGTVTVPLTFDPKFGSEALFEVPIAQELPLSYAFCREQTERGMMTSNRLFLLDLRKNFPKDAITRTGDLKLNRNAATKLKCLDKPLNFDAKLLKQPVVPVQFEWFFCSGDSLTTCTATKKPLLELEKFYNWPAQVRADGELYVPFVPSKIASTLENKRLICFMMGKPTALYKSPLKIDDKTDAAALSMVRPKVSEKVTLYDSATFTIRLPCEFNFPYASPSVSARVTWTFKKGSKTETLSLGSSTSNLDVSLDGSALIFKGRFSEAVEGTYSCTVTFKDSTATGSYEVTYTGPPRLDPSVPKEKLMVEGGSAELVCKYQQSARIRPNLAVCGDSIDFQDTNTINESMKTINKNYKDKILPVKFFLYIVQPKKGDIVRYKEIGAKLEKNLNPSHDVTCIGYQNPFSNRKRIVFQTVPKPKISLSCPLECKGSCDLKCEATSREQIETAGGEVLVSWSLHNLNATDSVPGTPIGNGSVFTYRPEEEGTQTVRCTAQLRVRSSGEVFFKAEKMSDPIRFIPGSSTTLTVIIVALILLILLVVIAIVVFVLLRQRLHRNRGGREPGRSAAEQEPLQNRQKADVSA